MRFESDKKAPSGQYCSDRFGSASKLLAAASVFGALCLAAPLFHLLLHEENDRSAARLAGKLDMTCLAVVPSGRSPRTSERDLPSLNADFSPFFPFDESDVKFLVLSPPGFETEIERP